MDEINSITINNENKQQEEEAEQLEELKQRAEEIHNYLTDGLDDYEDPSSIEVSIMSGAGDMLEVTGQNSYDEQYRQANLEDQLKVLYQVRVREVGSLNEEIQRLKREFEEQTRTLKIKVSLLESENEGKNVSLQESQRLLVEKVERIKSLDAQVNELKMIINDLENNFAQVTEEKQFLQNLNIDMEHQVQIMEKGFPLLNKTLDKDFQDSQRNKILHLESALNSAISQAERKEQQHKEMVQELKHSLQEKEHFLAEKGTVINTLTGNYDEAQKQCHELMKTIEMLRQTQKSADPIERPFQEELRKIREYNERSDIITENIKKVMSQEFQSQIATLYSENAVLKDTLATQEKELTNARHKLEVLGEAITEKDNLKQTFSEMEEKFTALNIERNELKELFINSKLEKDILNDDYKKLGEEIELLRTAKEDNKSLQDQLNLLESRLKEVKNPSMNEKSIQSSFSYINSYDYENLQREKQDVCNKLHAASVTINELEAKIHLVLQENSQLKVKVALENERENLIKNLQHKAAQFENIILERQKELNKIGRVSVGVNTEELTDTNSVLKLKYDALMFQTETKLRLELKKEFDAKLAKFMGETKPKMKDSFVCEKCRNVKDENKVLSELRAQDREAVTQLIQVWIRKFEELENETEIRLGETKNICEQQLILQVEELERAFNEKYREMKTQFELQVNASLEKKQIELTRKSGRLHKTLTESINKMAEKYLQSNEEILKLEKKCSQDMATLKR